MKQYPKNMKVNGTSGGTNRLQVIKGRQDQEYSPDVVTSVIQVFDFSVHASIEPGATLCFVTPYDCYEF